MAEIAGRSFNKAALDAFMRGRRTFIYAGVKYRIVVRNVRQFSVLPCGGNREIVRLTRRPTGYADPGEEDDAI